MMTCKCVLQSNHFVSVNIELLYNEDEEWRRWEHDECLQSICKTPRVPPTSTTTELQLVLLLLPLLLPTKMMMMMINAGIDYIGNRMLMMVDCIVICEYICTSCANADSFTDFEGLIEFNRLLNIETGGHIKCQTETNFD